MDILIKYWKFAAIAVVVLALVIAVAAGIAVEFPTADTIKSWSTAESIFYGMCAIAAAIVLKP